jgi:hypothetical protein
MADTAPVTLASVGPQRAISSGLISFRRVYSRSEAHVVPAARSYLPGMPVD